MLELLKVIVRAVVLERDEDGRIVGERLSEPEALYSVEQYDQWLANVRAQLNGGADGEVTQGDGLQGSPEPDSRKAGDLAEARGRDSRGFDA